ncbi:MAG: 4Fe-4S dicluster domain-containing protein [Acidobacteriia bacterium]|nr:4Fe-4S dicluster domain-containing protein [Terriglobia bacterium]
MSKGLLIDITKCIGCRSCETACKTQNGLPETTDTDLTASTYTRVMEVGNHFVRKMCHHCVNPTCVSVCPVGAMKKTASGPVVYDQDMCIGCRYCMAACPFQIPRYEWNSAFPRVRKCIMCKDRVAGGLPTACAEACPTGATSFGERDDLIREARERIRKEPDKYVNQIYGFNEVGGTGVMFISDVPFEKLGFRVDLLKEPLPELTWNVLEKIPKVVGVGSTLLFGIWWITNRREEVKRAEAEENEKKNDH